MPKYNCFAKILKYYWINRLNYAETDLYHNNFSIQRGYSRDGFNIPSESGDYMMNTYEGTIMETDRKLKTIMASINHYYLCDKAFETIDNTITILYHESTHLFANFDFNDKNDYGIDVHLKVYFKQFQEVHFKNTNDHLRNGLMKTVRTYINSIKNLQLASFWTKKFKSIGYYE